MAQRVLAVLALLLCLAFAQNTTNVFINLDPEATQDTLIPVGLTLKGTVWSNTAFYGWTEDGSSSILLSLPYSALDDVQSNPTFSRSATSFRLPPTQEFGIQAGLLTSTNELFLWGSFALYRVPSLTNLSNVEANVIFPNLILARTGFELNGQIYTPQWSASGFLPAQLYETDMSLYSSGFDASSNSTNLTFAEMAVSRVSTELGVVFAIYNDGDIEIRPINDVYTVQASLKLANVSAGGTGLQIVDAYVDATYKYLYVAGTQEDRGWVGRINVANIGALNGKRFTVYEPIVNGTFPFNTTDATLWLCASLTSAENVEVNALAVDTAIGVGYVNINDRTSKIGNLVKFDAVSMNVLGDAVITLLRDDTMIIGMTMRNITNGRAMYVATTGSITTFLNYSTSCSNDCNAQLGRGVCVRSKCQCVREWTGDSCEEEACVNGCGEAESKGFCRKGVCQCAPDWTGDTCSERRCPDDCNGAEHGTCSGAPGFTCACTDVWVGRACETPKFSSCESLNLDPKAETLCLTFEGCGWCFDERLCKAGVRWGPTNGTCRQWLVDSTYDIITVIFGAIIIFCFLVMFIINVISALMEDWRLATIMSTEGSEGDSMLARTQWWRDERSAKSWKLWDQLQFISYFSIINAVFSTRLIQFTGYFNWANFSLPWIFVDNSYHPERSSSLVYASIDQYANAHGMLNKMVYFNALIWWVIATVAFLVLYFLYYVLVIFILKKGGRFPEIMMHRVFHIITRALLAGYLPLILLAAFYITNYRDGLLAVPIIFGLLIAIGVPVLNFLVVKGEKTDFLYYSLRIRFGAFYVSYQHTRTKFAFVVFARKFLVAALIGFLAANQIKADQAVLFWVQSLVPAGLMLVYIVLLVILNPYIDLVHTILDIILNLINIITLATGYLHRSDAAADKTAGVFVAMILQIAGLVFVIFAYLWTWLFYAGYTSPGQLCSGKPEDEDDGKKKADTKADNKGDKKSDVKGVTDKNLKDLEISESD